MKLTTKMRYGTRALVDLALHDGQGPVSSSEVAEHQQVSVKYLESILATLRNAGLVQTTRGAQGGHMLARPPSEIDLREIFDVLEGSRGLVECTADPKLCTRYDACVTQEVWTEMYAACMAILEATTVADLANRARDKQRALANMYHI
jgi:Rrf2 family protein